MSPDIHIRLLLGRISHCRGYVLETPSLGEPHLGILLERRRCLLKGAVVRSYSKEHMHTYGIFFAAPALWWMNTFKTPLPDQC